jgi:hypothetical protein
MQIMVRGVYIDPTQPEGRMRLNELKAAAVRLRNFGANLGTITDTLGLDTEAQAEWLLMTALRDLVADDANSIRARQQATVNDIKRAMYPNMTNGDEKAANVIIKAMEYEGKLHPGVIAPQRVRVGLDQEAFTTTVDEDMRELGIHPQMDIPLDEGDTGWANT